MSPDAQIKRGELIEMSRELGQESRQLVILGEGNTSAKVDAETFVVKASGSNLASLNEAGVVQCRFEPLLTLLARERANPEEIEAALMASRIDSAERKPSIEALFHAWLLSLSGVAYVGHTHPVAVNSILCSPRAGDFANRRIFPDEVVCCGPSSVFVPYADPGLQLALFIARQTRAWIDQNDQAPRIILLENHGLIALGSSPSAVLGATKMAEKAAQIFVGAASLGGPVFLTAAQVTSIAGRRDEHYRQRALNL